MLSIKNLIRPGLEPVSLELAAGECIALRGPSGAGKSLLLRAVADLDPNEGELTLDGTPREKIPAPEWRRRVGYIPAEPGWWSERLSDHFQDWAAQAGPARRLKVSPEAETRRVSQLSTGERQRLALLRALEHRPEVLLLDEPTGPLDEETTAAVEALLREKQENGLAILWVTHDKRQAERVATRRFWIDRGRLREEMLEEAGQ
ncbi:ABC transporter ATP-binding protein [Pelagibius marinus]|uniref:ABC transporter ATP-binding protein n=1 Tax=Pelagibius marinus TaxID=2762760 RepID=UPI0018732163|nr:ABC transporter ATP-binding protein [Pelagibius marinus]